MMTRPGARGVICVGALCSVVAGCSSAVVEQSGSSAGTSASASASSTGTGAGAGSDAGGGATEDSDASSSGGGTTGPTPGIDLALVDLAVAPGAPSVGEAATITATVANLGADDLSAPVRVGFAFDGHPQPALDVDLAALLAGAEVELSAPLPWVPAAPGQVTVEAVVDADAAVDEADEANNYTAIAVTVGGSAGACRAIRSWTASAPVIDDGHVSHPLPSFASGGWFYVHTKEADGGGDRILYAAKPGVDGALGPWQVASDDHGGGPHGFTAVDVDGDAYHFRNGHIARYVLNDGVMEGDVVLVEDDVETAFGGNKYVWDSAVYVALSGGARHLIHLGGFSFTGYTYRPDVYRSAVPVEPTFTDAGLEHPSERPGKVAAFVPEGAAAAHVFTGEGGGAGLWRGSVAEDGAIAGWVPLGELPDGTGNGRGDLFIAGRTLFAIRGAAVYRADVDEGGELSPWTEAAALPEAQIDLHWGDGHLEGAAYGVIGDHVHVMGPKRAFSARLDPSPCAN